MEEKILMNVEFPYLYRDAGNWKKSGAIVFTNPERLSLAEAQVRLIAACERSLADLNWFIPELVGLEPLREGWDIDLDGPWHELLADLRETEASPTDRRTLREFVLQFEQAGLKQWLATTP